MTESLKFAKNRAYKFCEEQQTALDEGRITEKEWFDIHNRTFTEYYLAADNPRAQSGHSGGESVYRYTRGMILEAIDSDGDFLDVGCANGHLIEMLDQWLGGSGLKVEFYGLDISEGLLDLAKRRLPQWENRFFTGNAMFWTPEKKYDFVCVAELEYVPRAREHELMEHLLSDVVAPGGRFILGPLTEEQGSREMEAMVRSWGYTPTGYCEKSHIEHRKLCKRMLWFDKT